MSQYELAERSGISRATIANIETGVGDSARLDTLTTLALTLGVPPHEITDAYAGEADMGPLIERFLASDYGRDAAPTTQELEWLRQIKMLSWVGGEPTEKTVALMLDAFRSRRLGT